MCHQCDYNRLFEESGALQNLFSLITPGKPYGFNRFDLERFDIAGKAWSQGGFYSAGYLNII
jgi:hypothetical protein